MVLRGLWLVVALLVPAMAWGQTNARIELTRQQRQVLQGLAKGRYSGRWSDLQPAQAEELMRRANAYLADLGRYHLVGGQVVSVRFADAERSQAVSYEALDDSATLTGFLIAAHAYRYAVTRSQKAIEDIRGLLDGVETLLNVSGRPGYLARFAARAGDPAYAKFYASWGGADPGRPGLGRLAYPGQGQHADLVWLGGPSRDAVAALNYGLMTAHLQIREAALRARIAGAMGLILDRLEADQWRMDDGHGNVTFVPPLLRTTLLRSGATLTPLRHAKAYDEQAKLLLSTPVGSVVQYAEYRPNVFTAACLSILCRLEVTDPSRKLLFQDRLTQLWRDGDSHMNAFLATCYATGFERAPNNSALGITLQGTLYDFPDPPRWAPPVDHAGKPFVQDSLKANGQTWSKFALPVGLRPAGPFLWMDSPFALQGGVDPLVAHSGVDYLLAFWMARDTALVPDEFVPPPTAPAVRRPTR